jgi:hypothetical protein
MACALVSSFFLFRSQKHLFAAISLSASRDRTSDFYCLLARNPHLALYAQTLKLCCNSTPDDERERSADVLKNVLKKLVNVQALKLSVALGPRARASDIEDFGNSRRKCGTT